jgi:hypothetical protein
MSTQSLKPKAPPPPTWWSPKAGFWLAAVFAVLAGFPYARSAMNLLHEGKPVNMDTVKRQTMKMAMKKEKENYGRGEDAKRMREIKTLALAPDGSVWGGGKAGIFRQQNDRWIPVAGYPDVETKSISASAGGNVLVTGKHGVYLLRNGTWTQVYDEEAHTALIGSDGTLYIGTKEGLKRKRGQSEWEQMDDGLPASATPEVAQHTTP